MPDFAPITYGAELPVSITNFAGQTFAEGIDRFTNWSAQALAHAYSTSAALADFKVDTLSVEVPIGVAGTPGLFEPPPLPDTEIPDYIEPPDPGSVDVDSPNLENSAGAAPLAPSVDYTFSMPASRPAPLTVSRPGSAPGLLPVTIPEEGVSPEVYAPDLFTVALPPVPDIAVIEFEGERPLIDFTVPSQTFAFVETAYSSDLLDLVKSKITIMANGIGLTPEQELASFERARAREDRIAARAEQEQVEEYTARGFSLPSGILSRQLRVVRQTNQDAALEHSRKVELDNKLLMIDSIKSAIAQGIACEQMLLSAHLSIEERRFNAARFLHESLLAVFNARIALYNADVEGFKADAQVFRDRIQAELAKVEIYKAEVEAARVTGELNKTLVERYEVQHRVVLGMVEQYKARVQAAQLVSEVNRSRTEGYRAEVQAYGEVVRAYGTEWEAFKAEVEANKGQLQAGQVAADIFRLRVQAWSAARQADFQQLDAEYKIEELKLREFDGRVRVFAARMENERSKVQAAVQTLGAEAQVYSAAGQMAQAESAAHDRGYQLAISESQTNAQLLLKKAEVLISQGLQASAQMLQAKQGVAQTATQLAASSLNTINLSSNIGASASGSMGFNNSVGYNYSGEA